ncbi:MAG: hypothetical protein EBY02_07380, partial [Burkholderiaceae bacterium]|nr:hypothetical protein [Burkholderiaceae bacterium]
MNLSTRTTKNFAILVLSIGFSCTTLAQTKPAVVDPNKAPIAAAGIDEVYQLVDAVVTKVDSKTRTVTLKDKDGTVTNFVAGPEIKNFPQIKVGDRLTVTHELAVVIEL